MALDALQATLFSYACFSMCVYVFMVFTILYQRRSKNQILSGSFFTIVATHFVADFVLFLEFNILMRGRKYGYLTSFFKPDSPLLTTIPRLSIGLHYYIKIVVYIGHAIFAANRLSSAFKPLEYNNMWSWRRLAMIVLVQWTIPLIAILPICLNMNFDFRYVIYSAQNTLRLETDSISTDVIAYMDMAFSALCTIFSLVMYSITISIIRKSSKTMSLTSHSKRAQSLELRLLISAFIVFLILTLNTVIQVMTVVTNKIGMEHVMFVNDLSYPMIDLIYTCQPWALLISSSVIRKGMLEVAGMPNEERQRRVSFVPSTAHTTREF